MKFSLENKKVKIDFEVNNNIALIKKILVNGDCYYNYSQGNLVSYVYFTSNIYAGKNYGRYSKSGNACSEILFFDSYYIDRTDNKQVLCIIEKNDKILVKTFFKLFDESSVVSSYKEITNICNEEVDLECASLLTLTDVLFFDKKPTESPINRIPHFINSKDIPFLWKAHNSWCCEAVFEKYDLAREGLRGLDRCKRCGKINVTSNTLQSTSNYLPLGILENEKHGMFMFEISPSGVWSYEIEAGSSGGDISEITLSVTGKTLYDNGWYKILLQDETYVTDEVKFAGAKDLDELAENFTKYRRLVRKTFAKNGADYIIYNNFQQNTFDRPNEETDDTYIKVAKEMGADYYVIDAGWHDSCEICSPTQKIGEWEENVKSYPSGLNFTLDKARNLGMKIGLWVEVQSIGLFAKNKEILPEDCFFHLNGKRPITNKRYQLDFSNQKTVDFADSVIEKIVNKYKVDYIKIDHNQNAYGTDCKSGSLTEGMAKHVRAYNKWFNCIQDRYPNIIFESCASGGMSLDAGRGELTNLYSISDANSFYVYPYILANISIATLLEQNGVWNMPVRRLIFPSNIENKEFNTTDEEVIMNVINSFYGVMHLSSRLQYLSKDRVELLKEGNDYYRSLSKIKTVAVPIFPNGFTNLDDKTVVYGIKTDSKIYLSVYNMRNSSNNVKKDLSKYNVCSVEFVYPKNKGIKYSLNNGVFECNMPPFSARAFEFDIKK